DPSIRIPRTINTILLEFRIPSPFGACVAVRDVSPQRAHHFRRTRKLMETLWKRECAPVIWNDLYRSADAARRPAAQGRIFSAVFTARLRSPRFAALISGKTLKSCPDTCLAD